MWSLQELKLLEQEAMRQWREAQAEARNRLLLSQSDRAFLKALKIAAD